ncbi:hypothetical protein ACU6U9_12460 [Pseudomonas sp. HK3]
MGSAIKYEADADVGPQKKFRTAVHNRGGWSNNEQNDLIGGIGETNAAPGGATLNHSRAYSKIRNQAITTLEGLNGGSPRLFHVFHQLGHWVGNHTINGGWPGWQWNVVQELQKWNGAQQTRDDVDTVFHTGLTQICNSPHNLFYWPDQRKVGGGVAGQVTDNEHDSANLPAGGPWAGMQVGGKDAASGRLRLANARNNMQNDGLI